MLLNIHGKLFLGDQGYISMIERFNKITMNEEKLHSLNNFLLNNIPVKFIEKWGESVRPGAFPITH